MDYIIASDLGQSNDPVANIVLGRERIAPDAPVSITEGDPVENIPADDFQFSLLLIETLPIGTHYADVVERIETLATHPRLRGRCNIVVDRTGIGRAVVDLVRCLDAASLITWGITISSGKKEARDPKSPMDWSVPKKDLVGILLLALQRERIKARDGIPGGELLKEQLLTFRKDVRETGYTSFEAKGKDHDDLVLALCMGLWISQMLPYDEEVSGQPATAAAIDGHVTILPGMQPLHRPIPTWRTQDQVRAKSDYLM